MQLALVLDCRDPERLAPFWAAALGYCEGRFSPPYLTLTDPDGRCPELLLQRVPEEKAGKNRMHLDLRVANLDEPLERCLRFGAQVLRGPFDDRGWLTAVLADPEGNELCLIVPPAGPDRDATLDPRAPGARIVGGGFGP
ncbi:MAG TPA: VOC family protein [Actinospica sp.]|jgi:predicted enzyme related to lactoylglutathione lyase|nr:VOC family protein [Actinospica sp.]